MTKRTYIRTGAPWEQTVGYSRAVRVGNQIEVSGTVAVDNGEVVGKGDAYSQTRHILEKIKQAIEELGASMSDVIRTRMYVKDISVWEEVGRAHGEYFREVMPATSMVEVSSLIGSHYLVEIEATAVVDAGIK